METEEATSKTSVASVPEVPVKEEPMETEIKPTPKAKETPPGDKPTEGKYPKPYALCNSVLLDLCFVFQSRPCKIWLFYFQFFFSSQNIHFFHW